LLEVRELLVHAVEFPVSVPQGICHLIILSLHIILRRKGKGGKGRGERGGREEKEKGGGRGRRIMRGARGKDKRRWC
jgi:hypothetical protein